MRLYFIIVISFVSILFSNCNPNQKQLENGYNSLLYEIKTVKSESLLVRAKLKGIINPQKLELELELSNLTGKKIQVKGVVISTSDGLRSTPVNFDQKAII